MMTTHMHFGALKHPEGVLPTLEEFAKNEQLQIEFEDICVAPDTDEAKALFRAQTHVISNNLSSAEQVGIGLSNEMLTNKNIFPENARWFGNTKFGRTADSAVFSE